MNHFKIIFKPYQILFLFFIVSCSLNTPRNYSNYPMPSYNRYYQLNPNPNYQVVPQYNYQRPIQGYYDNDYSYTAPYGQNYIQHDYYPAQRPYQPNIIGNYRTYQPPVNYYNNPYNNYSNYPQDNDSSYYYNPIPQGSNSSLEDYDVSR